MHVLEYLWAAARNFYADDDPAAHKWVDERCRQVLAGNTKQAAAAIRRKATTRGLNTVLRTGTDECATYLANKASYLDYATALAQGWPIASGVIEGACRYLVADRMVFSSSDRVGMCPVRRQTMPVGYSSASYRRSRAELFPGGERELSGVPGGASRRPGLLECGR